MQYMGDPFGTSDASAVSNATAGGYKAPARNLGRDFLQWAFGAGLRPAQAVPVPRPQTIQASAAPSLPAPSAPTSPAGATGVPGMVPGAAPILSSGSFLPPQQPPQVPLPGAGGIGSDHSNIPWQTAAPAAPAPQPNPYQRASDVGALAQGNPYPSAPQVGGGGWGFNGAGFGAGDGFAPPFDMGQGSTVSGQDLVQKYLKQLFKSDT